MSLHGYFNRLRVVSDTAIQMRHSEDRGKLMELGCDTAAINKAMFETKSKEKIELERAVYDTIMYCADGKCAIIYTTLDMMKKLISAMMKWKGLPQFPVRLRACLSVLQCVKKRADSLKFQVRTNGNINASDFCAKFGGGGHPAAAGCSIEGKLDDVRNNL